MELNASQLLIVGFIATLLAQIIVLVSAKLKQGKIDKNLVSAVVFVVSMVLAYLFMQPTISLDSSNPAEAANTLLAMAAAVAGFATTIYNLLIQKIFDKLNLNQESLIAHQ